jgi:hypothetical protein
MTENPFISWEGRRGCRPSGEDLGEEISLIPLRPSVFVLVGLHVPTNHSLRSTEQAKLLGASHDHGQRRAQSLGHTTPNCSASCHVGTNIQLELFLCRIQSVPPPPCLLLQSQPEMDEYHRKASSSEWAGSNNVLSTFDPHPEVSTEPASTGSAMTEIRTQIKRGRTGCFTCRKRRKKCDETKPKCESSEVLVSMS